MSTCTLYEFREGRPHAAAEYKNAHGGAWFVWSALYDRYLPSRDEPSLTASLQRRGQQSPLWDLPRTNDLRLELFERAVLASTFDRAIIARLNFERYAKHLSEFLTLYPPADGVPCHLSSWAAVASISVADAIGFHQTSSADDPWFRIGDDGELVAYNLNGGKQHFEVYAWLRAHGVR